jgi:hypothetical protein
MSVMSVLLATLTLSAGAELQTLSGKKLTGELIGLDRQTVILRAGDDEIRHPVTDVLLVDLPNTDAPPKDGFTEVELTDGTVLRCTRVAFQGSKAELVILPNVRVTVPLSAVFTICRDAHDPAIRQAWQKYLPTRGQFDRIVVTIDGKLNGLDGTFGEGTGDAIEVTLKANGQKRPIRLANQIQGLIFAQKPNVNAPPPLCKVSDAAGNLLVAADLVLNAQGLTVTTVSGARIDYPDTKRLAKLDFSKGKLTYLSDLEPARQLMALVAEDDDKFAQLVRFRRDANLDNGPLRVAGASKDNSTPPKGLAIHAGTTLIYDIGGDYKEFRALLGVDEIVETESQVEVVIEGDGRELFRGTTSRRDPARPLTLDVKGVRELRIGVRATGLLDFGSQVDLVDAKVSK